MAILPGELTVKFDENLSDKDRKSQEKSPLSNSAASLPKFAMRENQLFIGVDSGIYRYHKNKENDQIVVPAHEPGKNSADTREKREDQLMRLTMLVQMRDAVYEIIRQQKMYRDDEIANMDQAPWSLDQQRLNDLYDAFVSTFGPMNKLTEHKAGPIDRDGLRSTVYRRMNLRQFRKDPDVQRVAAIEIFDPITNTAKKGDIFSKRVIRPDQEVIVAQDLEQALDLSQSYMGGVDFDYIAKLLGQDVEQVQSDLKNNLMVFYDPEQKNYQRADIYLSGDIYKKIKAAEKYAKKKSDLMSANLIALEQARPEWLSLSDIKLDLGNHWIPAQIVKSFAVDALNLGKTSITYSKELNQWFVQSTVDDPKNIEYSTDYFGETTLLQAALNQSPLTLRRRGAVDADKEKELGYNKIEAIKAKFQDWIVTQAEHAEKLERIYNQQFNAVVPFYGRRHSTKLPALSTSFDLYPHQVGFINRAVETGNVLGAAAVGAGKTLMMIVSLHEMKRLGKINKPLIVVPDNLRGQFSGDWMRAYWNDNILVMDDKYLEGDEKLLSGKDKLNKFADLCRNGDWDAVFMSQSSFDRFFAPPRFVAHSLLQDVNAAMALKGDSKYASDQYSDYKNAVDRYIAKKQRYFLDYMGHAGTDAAERSRIWDDVYQPLLQVDVNDEKWNAAFFALEAQSVTIDALGIDYIGMDEGHNYKNLFVHSQSHFMNKPGSARANDLYYKLQYLAQDNSTHYFSMMTATPLSNSLEELYSLQRYFQPEFLKQTGLDNFDVWRSMFMRQENVFESLPEGGSYRYIDRSVSYENLTELSRAFHSFADVVLDKDLNLPKPKKKGGASQIVAVKRPAYLDGFCEKLVDRGEQLRQGNVSRADRETGQVISPSKPSNDNSAEIDNTKGDVPSDQADHSVKDNMLFLLNQARYATLHPALVGQDVERDQLNGKIEALVENIAKIYHENKSRIYTDPKSGVSDELTGALQLVMCDLGVPRSEGEFSVYDDIKTQLHQRGVPTDKIEFIHDYTDDDKKTRLFERSRNGEVAVLIGTTGKLGTGTNVQKRLLALHNLDLPWRPDQWIQRNGRADRMGNWNDEIMLFDYVMEGSADLYIAQILERKAQFISQIMTGALNARHYREDDEAVMYFAALKAAAANDPDVFSLSLKENELMRLEHERDVHMFEQNKYQSRRKQNLTEIRLLNKEISWAQDNKNRLRNLRSKYCPLVVDGQTFDSEDHAGKALVDQLRVLRNDSRENMGENISCIVGEVYGLPIYGFALCQRKEINDQTNSLIYDVYLEIDDAQKTRIDISAKDLIKHGWENQLIAIFTQADNTENIDSLLRGDFENSAYDYKAKFGGIANRITAPYRSLNQDIRDKTAKVNALKYSNQTLKQHIGIDFDRQANLERLADEVQKLRQIIADNKKKKSASYSLKPDLDLSAG